MNFESTERTIAVAPEATTTMLPDLIARYGKPLPDGPRTIVTIGGFYGDSARTVVGAASFADGTITGRQLTDGRLAFRCLWQSDLAAAFDRGEIAGVEELTQEQLTALTPNPEEEL